jgi:hypothetical protein
MLVKAIPNASLVVAAVVAPLAVATAAIRGRE